MPELNSNICILLSLFRLYRLLGFSIPEIKGAINPSKMAVVLGDNKRVNGKLNNLKDRLIDFFGLPEVEDDTIWENDRNKFIESI